MKPNRASNSSLCEYLFKLSKAGKKNHFLDKLEKEKVLTSPSLFPKDVALLLYSFAKLKVFDEKYWDSLNYLFD